MQVRIIILIDSPALSLCFIDGILVTFDLKGQDELRSHLVNFYKNLSLLGYQELNTLIIPSEKNKPRSVKNPDRILDMKYFWATHDKNGNEGLQRFSNSDILHIDKIYNTLALIWRTRNPQFED